MPVVTPYGYYTLTKVFEKIGKSILSQTWTGQEAKLEDEIVKHSPGHYSQFPYTSVIYPIDYDYLLSITTPFLDSSNFKTDLKKHLEEALAYYYAYHAKTRKELMAKQEASFKAGGGGIKIPITIPDDLGENGESDKQKKTKTEIIEMGIRRAFIEKELRRLFFSGELKGLIIDSQTGIPIEIRPNFWISEAPTYDLATSQAKYRHYYTDNTGSVSGGLNVTKGLDYSGPIVISQQSVQTMMDRWHGEEKSKEKDTSKPVKEEKRGRKKVIDWEAFQLEAVRVLKNEDELPKQDYLATLMKNWAEVEFDVTVGLSTVKGRLKPIYDIFKTSGSKSEN